MQSDLYWMKRAIALSQKGMGFVHPNPMVGAIVVDKMGVKIGQGYHAAFGEKHAEIVALEQCGTKAKDATLYVTLEPCSHHGKTPPCVDAVIASKVKKVVIGHMDPNPNVDSLARLKSHGIEVVTDVCAPLIEKLNRPFFHWITKNQPYVIAKLAMDRHGYMGHQHKRIKISDPLLEHRTMKLRASQDAILIGSNTFRVDDPRLNVRGKYKDRNPIRIILDRNLSIQSSAPIFSDPHRPVWVFYDPACKTKKDRLEGKNIRWFAQSTQKGRFEPRELLKTLKQEGVGSLLIEGGAQLLTSFAKDDLIHDWVIYQSPTDLREQYSSEELVSCPTLPFSLDIQSAIRCGRDLVWET